MSPIRERRKLKMHELLICWTVIGAGFALFCALLYRAVWFAAGLVTGF